MTRKISYDTKLDYFNHLLEVMYTMPAENFKEQLHHILKMGFPIDFCPKDTFFGTLLEDSFEIEGGTKASFTLIGAGANVNRITHNGNTMLIVAILKKSHVTLIAKILELTQNINHKNKYNRTAFGYLCRQYIALAFNDHPEPLDYQRQLLSLIPKFVAAGADIELDQEWHNASHYLDCEKKAYIQLKAVVDMCFEQKKNMAKSISSDYEYQI